MAKPTVVKQDDVTQVSPPEQQVPKQSIVQQPQLTDDFLEADAGKGHENVGSQDLMIPFWTILQDLSPQVKKQHAKYIPGAEPGMLFNTVTKELVKGDVGIDIVNCFFEVKEIEWKPRDSGGGGLVAVHEADTQLKAQTKKDDKGRMVLPNGNNLVTTAHHFVLAASEAQSIPMPAIISMTSTQLKKSRLWNTNLDMIKAQRQDGSLFTPPRFAHLWHITTELEAKGDQSWYGFKVQLVGRVPNKAVYDAAKQLYEAVSTGKVKAKVLDDTGDMHVEGEGAEPGKKGDDIPF